LDISFVIVTYNSIEPLKECVSSLVSSINCDVNFEIIIVDNNSHDGSCQFIQENYPDIQL